MNLYSRLNDILSSFPTIGLDDMKGIKLMNRIDTKFVTTSEVLCQLLPMTAKDYYVQSVNGKRLSAYHTVYFDTNDYDMFYVHQSGHANRQKLRFRTYVDSDLMFMEVKTKNNKGRTKKKRIKVDDMNIADAERLQFLANHLNYDPHQLTPKVENRFHRVTLVNLNKTERLTIDTGLWFHNLGNDKQTELPPLVVIELKRNGLSPSPVLEMLRKLHIRPHGFSKYCMGQAYTNHDLRINRFKQKMREVEKILNK